MKKAEKNKKQIKMDYCRHNTCFLMYIFEKNKKKNKEKRKKKGSENSSQIR